jgi:hypothetical protein
MSLRAKRGNPKRDLGRRQRLGPSDLGSVSDFLLRASDFELDATTFVREILCGAPEKNRARIR